MNICALFFFAFTVLIFICNKFFLRIKIPKVKISEISSLSLVISFFAIMILCFYLWYSAYEANLLFSGYTSEYSTRIMGNMATTNLLLNFLAIYSNFICKDKIKKIYMALIIINSLFLLSMGGRMYVVTIIIPWLIIYGDNVKTLKDFIRKFKINLIMVSLIILFCAIGIFRLGIMDFSFMIYIFFAEPIFTSYSSVTYLLYNSDIPLLNNGMLFISSFLGIIPSFIMENKDSLYLLPEHMGFYYESPFGGTSIIVYLFTSFGIFGAFFFMCFWVFFYGIMSKIAKTCVFFKTFYLCALSIIPFIFFRESFYISTRIIVFPIFILPMCVFVFDRCLHILSRK
ncbi:MAG: oligosaccharide repeat unit polymerase [Candidatus Symbiopectobacterium sp. Dall1.0]|nr:oligosaccharide repeat unit polymerase [Candidatus Symbiopectobacterium sp. Dall1.0]